MSEAEASRATLVRRSSLVLVVLQVLLWAWVTVQGFFYLDDFELSGRAADVPAPTWAYLVEPHRGVVTPGARLMAWVVTQAAPLSWVAAALVLVAGQAAVSVLALHLLRSLIGDVPALLPALAVAILAPVALPGALWWSSGLIQLPQHLALLGSFALAVRWLRERKGWLAIASALAVVAGAMFSPRALLATPLVLTLSMTHLCDGSPRVRAASLARRWPLVGAHVAAVTLVVVGASAWSGAAAPTVPTAGSVVEIGSEGLWHAVLPGLVGGPWSWLPTGYAGAVAATGALGVLAALAVAAGVVSLTVAWWRGAAAAWWVVAGYILLSVVGIAAGPDAVFGALAGDDYRTQGDLALVAGLGLALASAPVIVEIRGRVPRSLVPRPEGRAALSRTVIAPLRAAGALPRQPETTGALVAVGSAGALAISSLVSTVAYAVTWVDNPARPIVTTTVNDTEALPEGTRVIDSTVPDQVATDWITPYDTTFHVFGPVLGPERELTPGTAALLAVMADPEGRLRRVAVVGAVASSGTDPGCGWRVGNSVRRIPFTGTQDGGSSVVRLGFAADQPTSLEVVVDGRPATVDVPAGLGSVYAAAEGPVYEVLIRTVPEGTEVCVGDGQAGTAEPLPGTQP